MRGPLIAIVLGALVMAACSTAEPAEPEPTTSTTTTTAATTTTTTPATTTTTAPTTTTTVVTTTSSVPEPTVEDRLLSLDVSRRRQTGQVVDTIVLHFISDAAVNPEDPYQLGRVLGIFEEYGVSAHYLIDREGVIYRLVDEERVAFHAGRGALPWDPPRTNALNDSSIGIEMMAIGSADDMAAFIGSATYARVADRDIGFTPQQYQSLRWLIDDIRDRRPAVSHDGRHIIGHEHYAPSRRTDPGELFDWSQIDVVPPSES